jgi:hypothetical protein
MISYFRRIVVKLNIAGYEHEIVSMDDYLKVKADADRLAEALKDTLLYVSGYASSFDEITIARAALAAHERGEG